VAKIILFRFRRGSRP